MKRADLELLMAYLNTRTLKLDKRKEEDIFELFSFEDQDIHVLNAKTKALLFLREHSSEVDIERFSSVLGIDKEDAFRILSDELVESYFPVVGKEDKLIKAFVVKLSKVGSFSFKKNIIDNLKVIESTLNQKFFVFFEDNNFAGSSFMLSIAAALVAEDKNSLIPYSFSGGVSLNGEVVKTGDLERKSRISSEYSKRLIAFNVVENLKELSWILNEKRVDIPFCVATKPSPSTDTAKEAALTNLSIIISLLEEKYNFSFKLIKSLYKFNSEDFVFYIEGKALPEDSWEGYLKNAYTKIHKLRQAIKDKTVILHFAFLAPSTFCFGLGAMIGCKEPFVVYHYVAGEYKPVLDYSRDNLRKLKSVVETKKLIKPKYIEKPKDNAVLAIAVYLASHNPIGDVKRFVEARYENYGVLGCEGVQKGNLAVEDWTKYINEIYSCYNDTKSLPLRNRLLFLSVPVPIAFGLGVAIEIFEKIDVFNLSFEKATYYKVFTVSSLKV